MAFPDIILVTLLAVSLYTDIKERKILNIVTVPAAAAGLLYNCAAGSLAAGLKVSLGGLLLGMGLLIIPFLMGVSAQGM